MKTTKSRVMKHILTFILISFASFAANCQNEFYPNLRHDNTRIFVAGGWVNVIMTFDSDVVNLNGKIYTVLRMGRPSVIFSTKASKLQFFTNEKTICNQQLTTIKKNSPATAGNAKVLCKLSRR